MTYVPSTDAVRSAETDRIGSTPMLVRSPASGAWRCVVLAEIANFSALRRLLGRPRSDTVITDVALRIAGILPQASVTVTGREIAEIAFEATDRSSLSEAVDALEAALHLPFAIDGDLHHVDILVAGATGAGTGPDDVALIEDAERALRIVRTAHLPAASDRVSVEPSAEAAALAHDLADAIRDGDLFLQYQPKVHLRRQEITSVEALVRWRHPTRGLILPNDFIPIAEKSSDIVALTLWTIRQSIRDQKILAARGHDLKVFINIAGVLLGDARFVKTACDLVQSSGARLGFEITETSVIRDPASAIANLQVFADIGITIAIDDYGAGLSSLAYLKQLPARELKIDKLFVTQLTSSNRDPLIVRSTIDLAHALEMEVVAEGVETQAAMALLAVMGCDMIQGFLISRPINLDALVPFLDEDRHLEAAVDLRAPFNRLATVWKRA